MVCKRLSTLALIGLASGAVAAPVSHARSGCAARATAHRGGLLDPSLGRLDLDRRIEALMAEVFELRPDERGVPVTLDWGGRLFERR